MATRKVAVDYQVHNVAISYMDHKMELDMRLWIYWTALPNDPDDWTPEWLSSNALDQSIIVDSAVKAPYKGEVYDFSMHCRFVQSYRAPMHLHDFPFDSHHLVAAIRFPRVHTHKIEGVTFLGGRKHTYVNTGDLKVKDLSATVVHTDPGNANYKPELHIQVTAKRSPAVYLSFVYIPLFCLTVSAFGVYLIPESEYADRLSSTLALIFATIGYQLVVANKLPTLSYLTFLDKYTIGGFLFTFLVLFHIISMRVMDELDLHEAIQETPLASMRTSVITFFGVYVFTHAVYIYFALRKYCHDSSAAEDDEYKLLNERS